MRPRVTVMFTCCWRLNSASFMTAEGSRRAGLFPHLLMIAFMCDPSKDCCVYSVDTAPYCGQFRHIKSAGKRSIPSGLSAPRPERLIRSVPSLFRWLQPLGSHPVRRLVKDWRCAHSWLLTGSWWHCDEPSLDHATLQAPHKSVWWDPREWVCGETPRPSGTTG
jgi:hypothetical protein